METLIPLFTAVFGGIFGYYIKFFLDKRAELESRRHNDKHPHYQNLLLCLKTLSIGDQSNNDLFFFEYCFLWLYAPDEVVQAANKLLIAIRLQQSPNSSDFKDAVAALLIAIRRDMGFSKTSLTFESFSYQTSTTN